MNLSRIMTNIYGDTATQDLSNMSFTGISGGVRIRRASPRIKYVDEQPAAESHTDSRASTVYNSYRKFAHTEFDNHVQSMTGGGGGDHQATDLPILTSPEYIEDPDFQKFIKEFYLHYIIVNAHTRAIIVLPESNQLKKMISDFNAELKSKGIEPYTPRASQYAAECSAPFKNYIFDVYGRNSKDNEGYPYGIPTNYPKELPKGILRRTNRLDNVYYFKLATDSTAKVGTDDKLTNAAKIELIAKCNRDVFVFRGTLPSASKRAKSKSNVVKALAGGSRQSLRKYFLRLLHDEHDLESAAYKFVGSCKSNLGKYYSGNFVHAAFSILADDAADFEFDLDTDYTDADAVHSTAIKSYSPVRSTIRGENMKPALRALRKTLTGGSYNEKFVAGLKKLYAQAKLPPYVLKADVATSLCYDAFEDNVEQQATFAMDVMDAIDGKTDNTYLSVVNNKNSPLITTISNALINKPFIGLVSKSYVPMLVKRVTKRSDNLDAEDFYGNLIQSEQTEQNEFNNLDEQDDNEFGFHVIENDLEEPAAEPVAEQNDLNEQEANPQVEFELDDELEEFIGSM